MATNAYLIPAALLLFLASFASAQPSQIAIIDFYGLQKVAEQDIRKHLGVKEGDSVRRINKDIIVKKLTSIPGVQDAHIATVCCDDKEGKWIVFVGIAENKPPAQPYNPAPTGKDSLPREIMAAYNQFLGLLMEGVMSGKATQDESLGHAVLNYPPAKPVQDQLVAYAQEHLPQIRQVLYHSADARHREAASWIIAYHKDKKNIAKDLVHAVKDPAEPVRNNATRALAVLIPYMRRHPDAAITISPEPFIELTNSLVWTDRNKGAAVLMALTEDRPPELMTQLKAKAIPSLIEMARWKNPGHALMSYTLLGRLSGMTEEQITNSFNSPAKDAWLADMINSFQKH